jgi:cell wall-associated NlpC family hydrolase
MGKGMQLKKVQRVIIAAALVCSLSVVPVFAAPSVSSLEEQKDEVEKEVSELQAQLNELVGQITDLQSQLIDKGAEILEVEEELAASQEREVSQYEDMKLRIKYMYEEGDTSALARILGCGSIAEMLSQAEYVQKIHSYDREMLNEYMNTVNQVATLKTTLEEEMQNLEALYAEYEAQSEALNEMIESKSAEVEDLDIQIQEAARLAAEEQARKEQEERERQEREAQAAAAAAAAAAANNNTTNTTVSNTTTTTTTTVGTGDLTKAQMIVNAAWTQIGVPYVWGGTTAGVGLDCSGLTQWCHAQAGISIPRVDTAQLAGGVQVTDPQPGDIAWTPGHVGIYIGNGQMIEAQQPGTTICVSPVRASVYVRYW